VSERTVRAGFIVASAVGGWHVCWFILVALGIAQWMIDFVLWIYFIKPIYLVEPFDLGKAAFIVVIMTALGFGVGLALAMRDNAGARPETRRAKPPSLSD